MSFLFRCSEKLFNLLNKFGPILILIMLFIFLSNLFLLIVYSFSFFIDLESEISYMVTSIFMIISALNIFFMVKLYLLKKWAFYAYMVTSLFVFLFNLFSGQNFFQSIWYLFPLFLLTVFFIPKRHIFN